MNTASLTNNEINNEPRKKEDVSEVIVGKEVTQKEKSEISPIIPKVNTFVDKHESPNYVLGYN
ncbi:MAG: hypothetical protein JKY81_11630 [Colwellia sp.]|nr:hypothetical protein [Colwellia sp.]